MKWTQRHSSNAVAAKARKRVERAQADPVIEPYRDPLPKRTKAVVTIQVRCHSHGDSLTLNLHRSPWANLWFCEQGRFSSAHLGRAIAEILKAT